MKQLALACHNMHEQVGYIPQAVAQRGVCCDLNQGDGLPAFATYAGQRNQYLSRTCLSYLIPLLPFIEQQALYEDCRLAAKHNFSCVHANASFKANGATIPNPYYTQVATIICPSEPQQESIDGSFGVTSYHCSWGDVWTGPYYEQNAPRRGAFGRGDKGDGNLAGMTDGTSATVLLSEVAIGRRTGADKKIKGGCALNVKYSVSLCNSYVGSNGEFSSAATPGISNQGFRWSVCFSNGTGFHTVLPPNSPTCAPAANSENDGLVSASSYHSGGVNVAMVDGSVRFVSDTINALTAGQNLNALDGLSDADRSSYSGRSVYGVWGALGSKNGGETTNL